MSANPFTNHPNEVGESYFQHLVHAGGFGLRMSVGALACLIHAVMPFLFVHTASRTMEKLYKQMHGRADAPNWERHPII